MFSRFFYCKHTNTLYFDFSYLKILSSTFVKQNDRGRLQQDDKWRTSDLLECWKSEAYKY
jgi:hypothetical protein